MPSTSRVLLLAAARLQKQLGAAGDVGFKQAMQSKWVAIDKSGDEPRVVRKVDVIEDRVLAVLSALAAGQVGAGEARGCWQGRWVLVSQVGACGAGSAGGGAGGCWWNLAAATVGISWQCASWVAGRAARGRMKAGD